MFIITDKTNAIIDQATEIKYWQNGYPFIVEKKLAYPSDMVDVYEVETIPEGIVSEQYCYTAEEGFFENPNYREPDPFDSPEYAAGYEQALLDLMELEFEEEE